MRAGGEGRGKKRRRRGVGGEVRGEGAGGISAKRWEYGEKVTLPGRAARERYGSLPVDCKIFCRIFQGGVKKRVEDSR